MKRLKDAFEKRIAEAQEGLFDYLQASALRDVVPLSHASHNVSVDPRTSDQSRFTHSSEVQIVFDVNGSSESIDGQLNAALESAVKSGYDLFDGSKNKTDNRSYSGLDLVGIAVDVYAFGFGNAGEYMDQSVLDAVKLCLASRVDIQGYNGRSAPIWSEGVGSLAKAGGIVPVPRIEKMDNSTKSVKLRLNDQRRYINGAVVPTLPTSFIVGVVVHAYFDGPSRQGAVIDNLVGSKLCTQIGTVSEEKKDNKLFRVEGLRRFFSPAGKGRYMSRLMPTECKENCG